ncbi:MAG: DNA polymerase ligase N-terminal domain-containing protein [Candidatus Aminicenantales bacterium]
MQRNPLRYDMRLEENGLLKSWALPKKPPVEPGVKRLTLEVEDHPLGSENFEGRIPQGNYGAGTVEIWDRGVFQPLSHSDEFIEFRLLGRMLRGIYTLKINAKKKYRQKFWLFSKNKIQTKAKKKEGKNAKA